MKHTVYNTPAVCNLYASMLYYNIQRVGPHCCCLSFACIPFIIFILLCAKNIIIPIQISHRYTYYNVYKSHIIIDAKIGTMVSIPMYNIRLTLTVPYLLIVWVGMRVGKVNGRKLILILISKLTIYLVKIHRFFYLLISI